MYMHFVNLYHLHWYTFTIFCLYKYLVILLLYLGSQYNVAIPPLIFVSYIQINITSGGMAAELVVPFVFILMLHLLSHYNVVVINMSTSSVSSLVHYFSYLRLGFPSAVFPSGFPTKPFMHRCWPPYVPHAPPISFFLDFITQIIFGEEYRSLSSSLCSFLQSPVTSPP
jgi:hypothetical protein